MYDQAEPNYRLNNPMPPEEEEPILKPMDFSLPNRAFEPRLFQGDEWRLTVARYIDAVNIYREGIERVTLELKEVAQQLCQKSEYLAEKLEQIEKRGDKPTIQETSELQGALADIEKLEALEQNLRQKIAMLKIEDTKSLVILHEHNSEIEN